VLASKISAAPLRVQVRLARKTAFFPFFLYFILRRPKDNSNAARI
jgi:hypothetical protein